MCTVASIDIQFIYLQHHRQSLWYHSLFQYHTFKMCSLIRLTLIIATLIEAVSTTGTTSGFKPVEIVVLSMHDSGAVLILLDRFYSYTICMVHILNNNYMLQYLHIIDKSYFADLVALMLYHGYCALIVLFHVG